MRCFLRGFWLSSLVLSLVPLSAGPIITGTAPACVAGTIGAYQALGATGCTSGGFTLFNFSFTAIPLIANPSTSTTKVATLSSVFISPPASLSTALTITSDDFDVQALDRVLYLFHYTIDPPPPILPGYDVEMFSETPISPGQATATASLCAGGLLAGPVCVDLGAPGFVATPYVLTVFHKGLPAGAVQLNAGVIFPAPTNLIDVSILLDLDARAGGSSVIAGVGARAPFLSDEVPEPASIALVGAGLFGLALLRRRT
jgi:hypothetical protein